MRSSFFYVLTNKSWIGVNSFKLHYVDGVPTTMSAILIRKS